MNVKRRPHPLAAVACLLALAGCSTSIAADRSGRPSPVPTPTAAVATDLHLPVEQYMLTPIHTAQLDWIRHAATSACMRNLDFDYPVPPRTYTTDLTSVGLYSVMARRYGVADPAAAHQWGYELPRSAVGGPDPAKAALNTMAKDEQVALLGVDPSTRQQATAVHGKPVPEHGCVNAVDTLVPAAASGGMQGPGSSLEGIVSEIKAESFEKSKADPRVTGAFATWATCMKGHGYDLTDPMTAPAAVVTPHSSTPSLAEIAQATADVACKTSTSLIGTWWAVEADLQNAAIADRSHDLEKVKSELDRESADIDRLIKLDFTTMPPTQN
jgi:hypothetical protein